MVIKNAVFVTSAASEKQFIKSDKPIIAVAGKSNVGKSSFINTIAGQKKLARTSDTPGRTRLINYFDFGQFLLADLPGYGYAKVSKEEKERWARVMERFFADKSNADFVFSLVDIRHKPTADDITMVNYLHANAFSYKFIATKADKISRMQVKTNQKQLADFFRVTPDKVIAFSSENGLGKSEVLSTIEEVINNL
ncbi:MAG: YihA family ribosome biogenesis GTP-binding protein, partial [Clostridia bacterium]|nr:YihA family ribosome biogenesis GTP-binding protein [Clostridia bacterium]